MLLRGSSFLIEARRARRAVPAFVAYNMEMVQGIVAAAEATGRPVILIAGSSAFGFAGLRTLADLALDVARESSAQVGVHLDHCRSVEEIETCLALGYSSVMFDGTNLSYEKNMSTTKSLVSAAHDVGAWVEAELVGISGDEDVSTDAVASSMTDPHLAREFALETGIDALSVAVGNVHGFTSEPPVIDFERLSEIGRSVQIPLVLHGASGLRDEVLGQCVGAGVSKVNVNAELRRAYLDALAAALIRNTASADLVSSLQSARESVTAAATRIIRLLDTPQEELVGP